MCVSKLRYFNILVDIIYYTLFPFSLEGWAKPSLHPFQHSRFEAIHQNSCCASLNAFEVY